MEKGSLDVPVTGPCVVTFKADGEYVLAAKGQFLGPGAATDRRSVIVMPPGEQTINVRTGKSTLWHLHAEATPLPYEVPDPTPIEIPVELRDMSLVDEIKEYVRGEMMLRQEDEGMETFEEANDFDMEEEEPELVSSYEFDEMDSDNSLDINDLVGDNVSRGTSTEDTHDEKSTTETTHGSRAAGNGEERPGSGDAPAVSAAQSAGEGAVGDAGRPG